MFRSKRAYRGKISAWDGSAEPLVQGRCRVDGDGSRAKLKPAVNSRIRGFQARACKRFGGTQIGRKGANGLNISARNLAEYGAVSSSDESCNRMESIMRVSHLAILLGLTLMNTGELRAEDSILRDLSVEQATAFQAGTPAPGSLRVSTWVDRHDLTYARGDAVRIFVKTNEDAYVTIVNVGPSGKVTQLFPNAFQQSNRVAANRALEVPSANGGSRINVSGPVGAELIKVFVSNEPIKIIPESQLVGSGAFRALAGGVSDLVRNLEVSAGGPAGGQSKFAISNLIIKTISSRRASNAANPAFVVAQAAKPAPAQPAPSTMTSEAVPPAPGSSSSTPSNQPSAPSTAIGQLEQPFPLLIAADKTAYRAGQKITLAVTSFRSCRLTVLDIDANGAVRVLFPTREAQNVQVQPMQTIIVSGESSPVPLQASDPSGQKQVVAVCSSDAAAPATVNDDAEQTITAGVSTESIANDAPGPMKPAETTAVAAVSLSIHP